MILRAFALGLTLHAGACAADSDLAKRPLGVETRWSSFENPSASRGAGGKDNRGAKGHPAEPLLAGETKTLLDVSGSGEIRRIWLTVPQRDPQMLRALRLEMFWDGAKTPAVSVPVGDFFGAMLGRTVPFESELFANPEGRSFVCTIPMPFRTGARIVISNESDRPLSHLFYDIDFLVTSKPDPEAMYFHASWRRERPTVAGRDFEILPRVRGTGRFLGVHFGVMTDKSLPGWWGEGEVKMYLDGDEAMPTLVGSGTEDYIGTAWSQGVFHGRYQGSLIVDHEHGQYSFYRYHVPDPVYFHSGIRVTIQQIGGAPREAFEKLSSAKPDLRAITVDSGGKMTRLLEPGALPMAQLARGASDWVNYYRQDDWSATALFYLDAPENGLPRLAAVAERMAGLAKQ